MTQVVEPRAQRAELQATEAYSQASKPDGIGLAGFQNRLEL